MLCILKPQADGLIRPLTVAFLQQTPSPRDARGGLPHKDKKSIQKKKQHNRRGQKNPLISSRFSISSTKCSLLQGKDHPNTQINKSLLLHALRRTDINLYNKL